MNKLNISMITIYIHSWDLLPPPEREGESEKLKKRGGTMVQGQLFLKEGG